MVEFGLKLEDNKVSEWSEHYLDYEALKKILKKAKNAEKKYRDSYEKNPSEAELITQAYRSGDKAYITMSSSLSVGDFSTMEGGTTNTSPRPEVSANNSRHGLSRGNNNPSSISLPTLHSQRSLRDNEDSEERLLAPTERTALLQGQETTSTPHNNNNDNVDTEDDTNKQQQEETNPSSSTSPRKSGHQSIQKALSNISDHLSMFSQRGQKARESYYERQLRNILKEIDDQTIAFDELFHKEQKKVVSFYYAQLQELESRLEYVIETVDRSYGSVGRVFECSAISEEGGDDNTSSTVMMSTRGSNSSGTKPISPFPTHRKQASSMGQKMEEIFQRLAGGSTSSIGSSSGGGLHNHHHSYRRRGNYINLGGDDDEDYEDNPEMDEKRIGEAESIKRSLVSQYRTAKLLHNYAIMNITGFVKIAKKFDKTVPSEAGRFKTDLEPRNLLNDGKSVDVIATKYETYYANWFCEGDIRTAKAQMLSKQGDGLEMDWSQVQLGYRMGMCAVLALWVCWDCIWGLVADGNSTIGGRVAFPVFRACGGLLLLQWFWGCSVFIWTRYRVNYIFLFDLDPRNVSTPIGIFAQAVDNTLIFMLLMLLYYKSGSHDMPEWIPPGGYPLILVFITTLKLIFPLRQRFPMWNVIFKVATAPLNSPTFYQTYVGDIFTSMVKVFQDIAWTICWVVAGDFLVTEGSKKSAFRNYSKRTWYKNILIPILTQLPLLIRFNQCLRRFHDTGDRFPHLANAAKYALSQMVTLAGTFHPLYLEFAGQERSDRLPFYQIFWTILFISSSLYSFFWDVYMDWGLGRKKYGSLAPQLMYPKKYYYYITIAIDLVLRFMWVLTLVPPSSGASFALPEYLNAMTMMLELFRRTIWGFFRLENEHRSNASRYRRVDFVPLHFNTGHQHKYNDKKERSGSAVLREVVLVALIVGVFCFASIVAAQHANRLSSSLLKKTEL